MKIRKNDVTMQRLDFAMDSLCYDTTLLRNSYIAFKKVACKYFMNKDAYHEIFWVRISDPWEKSTPMKFYLGLKHPRWG